jgi:hypothetical protein
MTMDSNKLAKLDVTQLEVLVREDIDKCLEEVTAAVNKASEGAIINESEEPVRESIAASDLPEGNPDEGGRRGSGFFPLGTKGATG